VNPSDEPEPASTAPAATLGAEIRRLRRERGLSQRAFTRMLGLSAHSNLADYETARRLPPADIVTECERALNVTDGYLHRLHTQALADRATDSSQRTDQGSTSPQVREGASSARRRLTPRVWRSTGLTLAGTAIIALGTLSLNAPGGGHPRAGTSHPPGHNSHAARSPNGTPLADGLDPKQAACDGGVITLDAEPLRLTTSATVQGHRLVRGTVIGLLELRYSAACQAAWGRLDPRPIVSGPNQGSVDIYTVRPADGTRTAFHLHHVEEVYVDMLLTKAGCIQAQGAIHLSGGPTATATTQCLTGPPARSQSRRALALDPASGGR
jgi:transcriptional regulator with XRE-family HTH domain